jgi:hypothetical protein
VFATVTLKVPVVVRPRFVTAQLTTVVPKANVLPDAGVHVGTSGPSVTLVAVAV